MTSSMNHFFQLNGEIQNKNNLFTLVEKVQQGQVSVSPNVG